MKKAAIAVLFLAGAVVAASESGKMGGFGNFISDVQAEDELSESDKDQKEIIEESDTTESLLLILQSHLVQAAELQL